MKTSIRNPSQEPKAQRPYPVLKVNSIGMYVLFTEPGTGVFLHDESGELTEDIGVKHSAWNEGSYTETDVVIEIMN